MGSILGHIYIYAPDTQDTVYVHPVCMQILVTICCIPFDNFWPHKHSEIPAKPTYPVGTIDRYRQKPAIHGKMSVLSMCPILCGRMGPLRVAPQAVHSVNDQRVAPNSMIQDQSRFTRLDFARSYGILGSRLDSLPLRAPHAHSHSHEPCTDAFKPAVTNTIELLQKPGPAACLTLYRSWPRLRTSASPPLLMAAEKTHSDAEPLP